MNFEILKVDKIDTEFREPDGYVKKEYRGRWVKGNGKDNINNFTYFPALPVESTARILYDSLLEQVNMIERLRMSLEEANMRLESGNTKRKPGNMPYVPVQWAVDVDDKEDIKSLKQSTVDDETISIAAFKDIVSYIKKELI